MNILGVPLLFLVVINITINDCGVTGFPRHEQLVGIPDDPEAPEDEVDKKIRERVEAESDKIKIEFNGKLKVMERSWTGRMRELMTKFDSNTKSIQDNINKITVQSEQYSKDTKEKIDLMTWQIYGSFGLIGFSSLITLLLACKVIRRRKRSGYPDQEMETYTPASSIGHGISVNPSRNQ